MKHLTHTLSAAAGLALMLLLSGCDKELDTPPERTLPTGSVLSIKRLRDLHATTFAYLPHRFTGDSSVYGVVTGDETNGNLYKNIYMQDDTAGIVLRLKNSGGLYAGDRIRIYLKGTTLSSYAGLLQLDSVDVDNNVIKQETLVPVAPKVVSVTQVTPALQGQLIRLDSVQFIADEANGVTTWSDAINQSSVNRTLEDCDGNTIIVRTSGYANFAAQVLPQGNGSFTAVVGQFGSDMQLFVHDLSLVQLTGPRCGAFGIQLLLKDFEDGSATSGGWTQQQVTGTVGWTATAGYGSITNNSGGVYTTCETWLISPSVNLSATTAPVLNFETSVAFSGAPLEVLVSTNYSGGAPSTATWTALSPALAANATWTPSGGLDLIPYISGNFRLAFKYTGTSTDGRRWNLDDIVITDN